jgi:starvation-inducible DNA-binding protein
MTRPSASAAALPPSDLGQDAVSAISAALNRLLADRFALYIKTKNFHWHMTGPHFRDYHRLLDEQASEILAMTDPIAERVRIEMRRYASFNASALIGRCSWME